VKIKIYSALYGAYEEPKPLPAGTRGLLFTERRYLARGWSCKLVDHHIVTRRGDPALTAPMLAHKYWKCHPGEAVPDADVSVWLDSSISLDDGFIDRAVEALGEDDWLLVRHPWRTCIYEEAAYSGTLPRYQSLSANLEMQSAWYKDLGHPVDGGLPATGILVRRHTPKVLAASAHWWQECLNWSHQDQVSLPVLLDMLKIKHRYGLEWQDGWTSYPHLK